MIRDRIIESSFSSYFIETKGLGILEIKITKELSGKKISDLNINNEFLVATLVRNSETILPSPDFIINRDDLIVGIAKVASIDKIKKMFNIDVQKTGD